MPSGRETRRLSTIGVVNDPAHARLVDELRNTVLAEHLAG